MYDISAYFFIIKNINKIVPTRPPASISTTSTTSIHLANIIIFDCNIRKIVIDLIEAPRIKGCPARFCKSDLGVLINSNRMAFLDKQIWNRYELLHHHISIRHQANVSIYLKSFNLGFSFNANR